MRIHGDLIVTEDNAHECAGITSVSGVLSVFCDFSAPLLTECAYAVADGGSTLSLPLLTECAYAVADGSSTLNLPLLTKCNEARADGGSTLSLPLLTECAYAVADGGSTLNLPLLGEIIADDGNYALFRKFSGTYHAWCRQGLTAAQALKHWGGRTDARAKLFTAAIKKAEKAATKKG